MQTNTLKAVLWMGLSALGFGSLSALVKKVAPLSHGLEVVFVRSFLNFFIALSMHRLANEELYPKKGRKILLLRSSFGFVGISCFFYSLEHLPVSIAALINWSSPLFIVVLSWIFLKERLSLWSAICVALSFLGLVLIVLPPRFWLQDVSVIPTLDPWAIFIAILGAFAVAGAYTSLRAATSKLGVNTIILYFMGLSSLLSFPFAIHERFWVKGGEWSQELIMLWLGIAFSAAIGQYGMTQGYRYVRAAVASTMGLLNGAVAMFWGWLFFDELLSIQQWVGVTILWASIGFLVRLEHRFYANIKQ